MLICVIGNGLASDVFFRKERLDTAQVIELAWKSLRKIHDAIWHKEPAGKVSVINEFNLTGEAQFLLVNDLLEGGGYQAFLRGRSCGADCLGRSSDYELLEQGSQSICSFFLSFVVNDLLEGYIMSDWCQKV